MCIVCIGCIGCILCIVCIVCIGDIVCIVCIGDIVCIVCIGDIPYLNAKICAKINVDILACIEESTRLVFGERSPYTQRYTCSCTSVLELEWSSFLVHHNHICVLLEKVVEILRTYTWTKVPIVCECIVYECIVYSVLRIVYSALCIVYSV